MVHTHAYVCARATRAMRTRVARVSCMRVACVYVCVCFLSACTYIYTYRPSIIFTPDITGPEDLENLEGGSARVSRFRLPAADPISYAYLDENRP